jgi:hypothetical protein
LREKTGGITGIVSSSASSPPLPRLSSRIALSTAEKFINRGYIGTSLSKQWVNIKRINLVNWRDTVPFIQQFTNSGYIGTSLSKQRVNIKRINLVNWRDTVPFFNPRDTVPFHNPLVSSVMDRPPRSGSESVIICTDLDPSISKHKKYEKP